MLSPRKQNWYTKLRGVRTIVEAILADCPYCEGIPPDTPCHYCAPLNDVLEGLKLAYYPNIRPPNDTREEISKR